MITLIVWDRNYYLDEKCEYLTLRELGQKLVELSEEWILVFDRFNGIIDGVCFTMEITKAERRNKPTISEHMDSDMERGVEF